MFMLPDAVCSEKIHAGDSAAPDNPKSAADLKLILAGQILDNSKTLSGLRPIPFTIRRQDYMVLLEHEC